MGKGLGKIQRRILEVLKGIDSRWFSQKNFAQRWVSLNILVLAVYNKPINPRARLGRDYSKNEHRRVWESTRMLEKRGLVRVRIERIKGSGYATRWGGIQRWMEVKIV